MNEIEVLSEFKVRFLVQLEKKNSWGKNELKDMFVNTMNNVLLESLSNKDRKSMLMSEKDNK